MKLPLLFPGLAVYVIGLLLQGCCSPLWMLLPVIAALIWWLYSRQLIPLLYACILAMGALMPLDNVPSAADQPLWQTEIKASAESRLAQLGVSEQSQSLAIGMIFGDKSRLDTHLKSELRQAGMSHLMAVSGLHVGVLWMILGWLLAPFRLICEHRVGRYVLSGEILHQGLLLFSLWFYIIMVGCPPSALRAGIMITLVTFNGFFSGQARGWHCLSVAAFGMLLVHPSLLWSVGFQLSILAVAGILSFRPVLSDHEQPRWFRLLMLTVSAQLFTLPVSAYYFHGVPVFGWLQGLLVVPLMPVYLCLLVAGTLLPQFTWLAYPIDYCTVWIRQVALWTNTLEETLLGGHLTLYPSLAETFIALAVIIALTWLWNFLQYAKEHSPGYYKHKSNKR